MLKAKQESEAKAIFMRGKVETVVWTERMLAALVSGVKGGKWFSLWDKVWRSGALERAWEVVGKNRGAGGVDGVTIERFKGMKDKRFWTSPSWKNVKHGHQQRGHQRELC